MSTTNTLAIRPARNTENRATRATREKPRRKREASPEQKEAAAARRAEIRAMFAKISALPEQKRALLAARLGIRSAEEGREFSICNQLLIAAQCRHASIVGGFDQWRKSGRAVSKGQRAIAIWIPCRRGDTADGAAAPTEALTPSGDRSPFFILGNVFDISQTYDIATGEPHPQQALNAPARGPLLLPHHVLTTPAALAAALAPLLGLPLYTPPDSAEPVQSRGMILLSDLPAIPPPPPQPDRQPAPDPGPIVPVLVLDTRWNLRGRLAAYVTTLHPHAPRVRCMDSITFNPARPVDSLAADLRRRCLIPARQWWASILRSQRAQTSHADSLRLALHQLSHAAGAEVGPAPYGHNRDGYATADRRFSVCDYDLSRHATGTFPDHHDQRLRCSLSLSFPALLQVLKILQADSPNQPATK